MSALTGSAWQGRTTGIRRGRSTSTVLVGSKSRRVCTYHHCQITLNTRPKTNMSPKKGLFPMNLYIFHPLVFRGHSFVFQGEVPNLQNEFPEIGANFKPLAAMSSCEYCHVFPLGPRSPSHSREVQNRGRALQIHLGNKLS